MVTDPRRLNRRRLASQHGKPIVNTVPRQIDQNIDLIGTNLLGHFIIISADNVTPKVDRSLHPLCISIRPSNVRITNYSTLSPIMIHQHRLNKSSHRVISKIRRDIADSQHSIRITPIRVRLARPLLPSTPSSALLEYRRRFRSNNIIEHRNQLAVQFRIIRRDFMCPPKCGDRRFLFSQQHMRQRHIRMCIGIVRIKPHRSFQFLDGFNRPFAQQPNKAQSRMSPGQQRVESKCRFVSRLRRIELPRLQQSVTEIQICQEMLRLQLDRFAICIGSRLPVPQAIINYAEIVVARRRVCRARCDGGLHRFNRLPRPTGIEQQLRQPQMPRRISWLKQNQFLLPDESSIKLARACAGLNQRRI